MKVLLNTNLRFLSENPQWNDFFDFMEVPNKYWEDLSAQERYNVLYHQKKRTPSNIYMRRYVNHYSLTSKDVNGGSVNWERVLKNISKRGENLWEMDHKSSKELKSNFFKRIAGFFKTSYYSY